MINEPTGMDVFAQPERPGLVFDLDPRTYHAGKNSLSASSAKILLGKRPPTSQDALNFGTLVHAVLLEPEKAVKEYAILDPSEIGVLKDGSPAANPTATSAWKQAVAAVEKSGQIVLSPAEWQRANDMANAVRGHKAAAELLAACPHREVSAYAEIRPDVIVRGRFDLLGDNAIADFKTCADGVTDKFDRFAFDYGYYLQAFVYDFLARANGIKTDGLRFILCEKAPKLLGGYRVSVTYLDDLYIKRGREDFDVAVNRWLALGKRVDLPDFPDHEVLVGCPDWLISDEMDVI